MKSIKSKTKNGQTNLAYFKIAYSSKIAVKLIKSKTNHVYFKIAYYSKIAVKSIKSKTKCPDEPIKFG